MYVLFYVFLNTFLSKVADDEIINDFFFVDLLQQLPITNFNQKCSD